MSFGKATPLLPTAPNDNVKLSIWHEVVGKELNHQFDYAQPFRALRSHTSSVTGCVDSSLDPPEGILQPEKMDDGVVVKIGLQARMPPRGRSR